MAKSKYEYVKQFEMEQQILPESWFVVRLDGQGFSKFTTAHKFQKPNDKRALDLMNSCASEIMLKVPDIVLAYGQSDEYSFVFSKKSKYFTRRSSVTSSQFASAYVFNWSKYFPDVPLLYAPSFDARIAIYPTDRHLRDYLCWRQADCHINNLYNTCFWELVKSGVSNKQAEIDLCKTVSSEKNELLFSKFGINYNAIDEIYRKGSVLIRKVEYFNVTTPDGSAGKRVKNSIQILHCDIIRDKFWSEHNILDL
ncbi:hypothetical protein BB560_001946 [Smittium megazygosporum]|uniref:tRNA(His) guanylyltransferase n=1 Tax=Smittium megazygosporum TaxID=133381 RepID=A0A2T9ZG52_9FUNG|nr:hypothetical protein BB560_001946 [Smittium megazygosporum]